MRIWTRLILGSCAVILGCSQSDNPASGPGTDAGGASAVQIDSVDTMSAAPMSLITLSGTGFDSSGTLWIRFLDAHGYALSVPAVRVTPTTALAAVPPYVDPGSGAIGQATVDLDVSADPVSSVRESNTIHGVQISGVPAARHPAGFVTSAFLRASIDFGRQLQTELAGSSLDTLALRTALARQIDDLSNLQSQVDAIVQDPTFSSSLGTVKGSSVDISADQLRIADDLLVGMLLAQANARPTTLEYGAFDVGCMQSEAATAAQAAQDPNAALDPTIAAYLNARSTVVCKAADAFNTGFTVVGAAGGVALGIAALAGAPASALALGAAGVLYVTIAGAGGMIALGGALGSATAGARDLVVNGVEAIEDKLRSAAVGFVLPETAGTLKDLIEDSADLYRQLSSASTGSSTSAGTGGTTTSSGSGGSAGAGGAAGSSATTSGSSASATGGGSVAAGGSGGDGGSAGAAGNGGSTGAGGGVDAGSTLCCCMFISEHYCATCSGCPQGLCIGGQCLSPCWSCVTASAPMNGWACGATCNAQPSDRCDVACP